MLWTEVNVSQGERGGVKARDAFEVREVAQC